ncbi:amidase family protein [Stella sp.]|uniref:amidase family protein n=1 Tax=Stella sp. TaxID=2912054 RepID=UPI0035B1E779
MALSSTMTPIPDLSFASAMDLLQGYTAGSLDPVAVTEHYLARIAAHNRALNAFCHVDADGALSAARASAKRWREGTPCGPLDGVPATIKDFFEVAGMPTRRGSRLLADAPPAAIDAPAVARLREAGAVLLGKTTTTEFGHKASGVSPLTGVTRNPLDPAWSSGGSSCGAGVATAAGLAPLNLGSDAAGSIRIPAAFCGVYGHKPSGGLVPAFPPSAFGHAAVLGPMTRTVADGRLMLRVMARPNGQRMADDVQPREARHLRLVAATGVNDCRATGEALDRFEAGLATLAAAGARIERREIRIEDLLPRFLALWHVFVATATRLIPDPDMTRVEPTMAAMIRRGRTIGAVEFNAATVFFAETAVMLEGLIGDAHALLLPTLPFGPFGSAEEHPGEPPPEGWLAWGQTCWLFNATMMPASSVPYARLADGRPLGLQVVGHRWSDARGWADERVMAVAEIASRLLPFPAADTVR